MIADYAEMMSWVVALLIVVSVGIVVDFLRTWWTARALQLDLEKSGEIPDYHSNHFDLRRER